MQTPKNVFAHCYCSDSAEGHDIDSMNASAGVYDKLPECCHYQRKS